MRLLHLVFVVPALGHFLLNYPPTIGFDDSLEGDSPCGSFTVDFTKDNVTDFYVGGNAVAITSIHPQATWLFRATLDTSAAGAECVLGVVQDAPDGILYQCAAVNFVAGVQHLVPGSCTNVTGLSASFTCDPVLATLATTATTAATSGSTEGVYLTTMTMGSGTAAMTTTMVMTSSMAMTTTTSAAGSGATSKSQAAGVATNGWGGRLGVAASVFCIGALTFAVYLV
ncbi:expression library immunization antigen 1 [Diplogelasinospora grovesii]|uniref:Expression library immunization antigen 1 n=1 Tax=Diplogelasinospora grovesii TaxID=303347 RepID=A0AAN6RXJ8_9PEZI|nr:expression library immunization antigen 1 [Diplogelasinospora grovesii]